MLSVSGLKSINLAAVVEANTPAFFKQSSLLLTDNGCDELGNTPEKFVCSTIFNVKSMFFSGGWTDVHTVLARFDDRLNGALATMSTSYYPCMDATYSRNETITVTGPTGAPVSAVFSPYSLLAIPLATTFNDGSSFDTGKSLKVSCAYRETGSTIAYGYDSGVWSLFENNGTNSTMGTWGTTDSEDNIDLWMKQGDPVRDAAQNTLETSGKSPLELYPMGTSITHIIARPKEGLLGLAQIGTVGSQGCYYHFIMNKTTLYFRGNTMRYGECTETDFSAPSPADVSAEVKAINVVRRDTEICMLVDGSVFTKAPNDLDDCVSSGLISKTDEGIVQDPFTPAGLTVMTTDMSSTTSGVLKARAWMASFFMNDKDLSSVNPMNAKPLPSTQISISGANGNMAPFFADTVIQNGSVKAACTASDASKTSAFTQTFTVDFADVIAKAATDMGVAAAEALQRTAQDFARTGDLVPYVEIPVSRTKGTTYRGVLSVSAQVTADSVALGSATGEVVAGATSNQVLVKIPLSSFVPGATTKLNLAISGTISLSCDNAIGTQRTVSAVVGMPRLVWFHQ